MISLVSLSFNISIFHSEDKYTNNEKGAITNECKPVINVLNTKITSALFHFTFYEVVGAAQVIVQCKKFFYGVVSI